MLQKHILVCNYELTTLCISRWSNSAHHLVSHVSHLTHLPDCRIYASVNLVSTGYDNNLSPIRDKAWLSADLLSIGLFGTRFSEICQIWIKIQNFSFVKMHLQMSPAIWRPSCPEWHLTLDKMAAISQATFEKNNIKEAWWRIYPSVGRVVNEHVNQC